MYSHNLERSLGQTSLTPCQLSYASLVPIILKVDVTKVTSPVGLTEVDIRSCLMSLIDFYRHWLSNPIDLLLLHHILISVIMLSDMFGLSSQYEWMLETFLGLSETHPQEDHLSDGLLVLGAVKSAAVLRVVRYKNYYFIIVMHLTINDFALYRMEQKLKECLNL